MINLEKTVKSLEKNNMAVYIADTKEDVIPIVKSLINKGDSITCGGSVSLQDCGVADMMKNGDYLFLDRSVPGLTPEQVDEIYAKGYSCDAFFCSANAVTENGELYNVDGRANRISFIAHGPKKVICVVGINKIVEDIPAAVKRVKTVAAPLNCKRLNMNTPCFHTGKCIVPDGGMGTGCASPDRICCDFMVSAYQRVKNRVNVIICRESLGY